MRTANQQFVMRQTVLAIAVLAAIGQARAQMSEEVRQLTTPDAWISVGAAGVTGDTADRAQFGQFNGMREHKGYLLLDGDYTVRDNATGTWTSVVARNLGLDNREIRATVNKQGDWKLFGEWNQITRHSPFTVNTGMLNVGSTTPQVVPVAAPGAGSDYDFKLERKAATVGGEKWIFPNLKFEAVFKNETKEGNRLWGRGYDCANYVCGPSPTTATIDQTKFLKNAILMIPEPIDSVIRQIDARLQWSDEKLNLTAAYYGNIYKNDLGSISPIVPNSLYGGNDTLVGSLYPAVTSAVIAGGGTSLQNVLQLPMSLQPDSQAHQFSLSGNYTFTPTTKATFKYAYTHATQDKDFLSMGLPGAPAGVSNLDGRVDSVAAQFGLTSRPIKDLSLLANVSYLRREDKTPNALYNVEAKQVVPFTTPPTFTNVNQIGVPGAVWNNNHVSNTNVYGKLEASYRLPYGLRGTLGWDYRSIERLVPESRVEEALAGLGPLREKNDENGWRIELRRSMSETLNGSVSYLNSRRRGSDWTNLSTQDPGTLPTNNALTTYLINTYCGGAPCYGLNLPASAILGINPNTPFPASMADVNREKWRGTLDWTPMDRLSLQVMIEGWKDTNETGFDPVAGPKGWRDSDNKFYSLDASYVITDNWKLTGYASYGDQTTHVNHSTGYLADLHNKSTAVGLQLAGQVSGPLQVGANLTYINDINKYNVAAATGTTGDRLTGITATQPNANNLAQAAIGLNDVTYRKTVIGVYGQYMLNKFSDVRFDVMYNKYKYDDWVWGQEGAYFFYADNSIVKQKVDQSTTLFALTYIYRFR